MDEDVDRVVETPPPMDSAGNVVFRNLISASDITETLGAPCYQDLTFVCQPLDGMVGSSSLLVILPTLPVICEVIYHHDIELHRQVVLPSSAYHNKFLKQVYLLQRHNYML